MCVKGICQFSAVGVRESTENVGILWTVVRQWRSAGGDGGGGDDHHHNHKEGLFTPSTSEFPNIRDCPGDRRP